MPSQYPDFFGTLALLSGQHAVQNRVAKDRLASTPIFPLPLVAELRQGNVELSHKPPASALFCNRIFQRWRVPRKKWEQAPYLPA